MADINRDAWIEYRGKVKAQVMPLGHANSLINQHVVNDLAENLVTAITNMIRYWDALQKLADAGVIEQNAEGDWVAHV